jgi:hypothetical protein
VFNATNTLRQTRIRDLADALKALSVGDEITHAQIEDVTGISPCPNELFQAAHAMANREAGCYCNSVRGVGYIKIPASEWEGVGIKYRKRVRRAASKGRKFVSNIVAKTNVLSDEEQRRASRETGLLQTIEAMTRRIAGS